MAIVRRATASTTRIKSYKIALGEMKFMRTVSKHLSILNFMACSSNLIKNLSIPGDTFSLTITMERCLSRSLISVDEIKESHS